MNCQDTRQHFPELLTGDVGLSESAQVEAHVRSCAECGDLLEELYRLRPRHHQSERRRIPLISDHTDADPGPFDPDAGTDREPRRWFLLTSALVSLVVLVSLGGGLAFYREPLTRILKGSVSAVAQRDASPTETREEPPPLATPSPPVSPDAPADPPAPEAGTGTASNTPPNLGSEQKTLPPRKAKVTTPAEKSARAPVPTTEPSVSDVVVQLSVRDRSEAERDITHLLGQLGGTKLGRSRGSSLTVTIPRSTYGAFTRDLAQIGPWQMEPLRAPLPDPVRVTVKLAR